MGFRKSQRNTTTKAKKSSAKKGVDRLVLLIGDDGAILVFIEKGILQKRLFSSDAPAEETSAFRQVAAEHADKPLYVFFDTLDQSYVQQTLPPVSSFSTKSLINRKLEREFSKEEYLTDYIMLGRESTGRKDWNYMMLAQQLNPSVSAWIKEFSEWPCNCQGIHLLPVELPFITKKLVNSSQRKADQWFCLVSYNRVSGIRQVISKKGKIVFTRLGQPPSETNSKETIAGTIEQEVIATLEYVKRLGMQNRENLSLAIIVSDDVKAIIDTHKFHSGDIMLYTPYEAMERLGLPDVIKENDRFGDVLLSVACALLPKKQITLFTPRLRKYAKFQRFILAEKIACGLALLATVVISVMSVLNILNIDEETSKLQHRISKISSEYTKLETQEKETQENLVKITDTVAIYEQLEQKSHHVEPFIERLYTVFKEDIFITSLNWQIEANIQEGDAPDTVRANISVEFSTFRGGEEDFLNYTKEVKQQLLEAFPDYTIEYSSLPGVVTEDETLNINIEEGNLELALNQSNEGDIRVADLMITGPYIREEMEEGEQ